MGLDAELCRKGGLARSQVKTRAARVNGEKGGRPQSRTLAERILRRRISQDQQKAVTAAFKSPRITYQERKILIDYFDVLPWERDDDGLHTTGYKWPRGKIRKDVLLTMKLLRLLAGEELRKIGKPKPPKDYVIELIKEERSDADQNRWYEKHDTHPLPRRFARRIYFRNTSAYRYFDALLSHDSKRLVPTAKEIKDQFGSELGPDKVSEAIAEDLRAKYPRPNRS